VALHLFPCVSLNHAFQLDVLRSRIMEQCLHRFLVPGTAWVEKMVQLYQIQLLRHGVMMVGPSGSGKSSAWRVLLEAMHGLDGVKGEAYVIDPKAISKEQLYGTLGTWVFPCTLVSVPAPPRPALAFVCPDLVAHTWTVYVCPLQHSAA
jgi:hypothetical protein